MALKAFTTKLDEKTVKALKAVSERTRIPQSELVREGVDWLAAPRRGHRFPSIEAGHRGPPERR